MTVPTQTEDDGMDMDQFFDQTNFVAAERSAEAAIDNEPVPLPDDGQCDGCII